MTYRNLDLLHDALVNAWVDAGACGDAITGSKAFPWHFGVLGWHYGDTNRCHTLVVGSPDPTLSNYLKRLKPNSLIHARAQTAEFVDFSKADVLPDPDPVAPGQSALGVVMLSPLAISRQDDGDHCLRWHTDLKDADISNAVSHRLSRLAGRRVELRIEPDRLYLRTHPHHDSLIQIKELKSGRRSFVIGMRAPLIFHGKTEDLRFAWYAGVGEKNRMGFGCIGLVERGVGR